MSEGRSYRSLAAGVALAAILALGAWADRSYGWVAPAFRGIGTLFYEQSALAALRVPSQIALVRMHLVVIGALGVIGLGLAPWLGRHGRWGWAIFAVGYTIRATIWVAGGNLPLVPGDSCHYVEVAASILHGEGPVKHYVESFFTDYRPWILQDRGILDDWATPLFAYLLAGAYWLTGVVPGDSLQSTFAVAKGLCFTLNLVTLPVVYVFARRRSGPAIALGSMAILAVLPVHAIYAGFELRESMVTLMSVIAVGSLVESWRSAGRSRYAWAIGSGAFVGLAILGRNTAMALAAAAGLYGLIAKRRTHLGPMLAWGIVALGTIAPWGIATAREFGRPFHSYTNYFPYNFSWAVHHYDKGNTLAGQFYTRANAPEIVRVKVKAVAIIAVYATMILGLPLVIGFARGVRRGGDAGRVVGWVAVAFVLGTLASVADVTQVAQLGRYFVPVFVLMIPTAVSGLKDGWDACARPGARPFLAAGLVALLWADPSWAYDFTWLGRDYQLHWPALQGAGDWVRAHPEAVPPRSRILTWFPWEFRLASRRTTILMNRSLHAPHVERTIAQYGVSHVLWGSFEPPPGVDPELWGPNLAAIRTRLGLVPSRELYATPIRSPIGTYPVALYRIAGGPP